MKKRQISHAGAFQISYTDRGGGGGVAVGAAEAGPAGGGLWMGGWVSVAGAAEWEDGHWAQG